jgi:hypothetical protein
LFLAEGIEPGRLESPTPSPIPPQRTAAAAVDSAAVGAPPAKLTPPATVSSLHDPSSTTSNFVTV